MRAYRPPFLNYRRDLTSKARILRRDPTPPERKLWYEFLSARPEKFLRQKPLGSYIADFYCAQCRLVIELDGDSHFTQSGEARDRMRTAVLGFHNVRVLRFTNLEVMQEFEGVCARIEEVLRRS
jgi:very-short-patch-repair endonuclease